MEFIRRQPKVEKEKYDYRDERYGIVNVTLASQYWIGRPDSLRLDSGTKRLQGFLEQVSSCFKKNKGAAITDLRPMLQRAEKLFVSTNPKRRRPMLALYFLFTGDRKFLLWDAQKLARYNEALADIVVQNAAAGAVGPMMAEALCSAIQLNSEIQYSLLEAVESNA